MATSGYAAAIDSGDVLLSYGIEATWGTKPATQFQQLRMLSESFSGSKSRTRPSEITNVPQAAAALTTKVEAIGDIQFALSYGTFDAFLASSMRGAWSTPVAKTATTIAATGTGFTDSGNGLVTAGIVVGQFLKVSGFTTTGLLANGYYRVLTVAAGTITTSPAPGAAKIAGDTVTLAGTMVRNGSVFESYHFQKQLAADKFLVFPGAWPTGGNIDVAVGDFAKGAFSFLCKNQDKATSDQSTGAQLAPPTGKVVDAISGITEIRRNGVTLAATAQKLGMKWMSEGARTQMGIGSATALGIGTGQVTVTGTLETYFADFSLYDEFIAETGGPISFLARDAAGAGYMFTICDATIMNPKIVAGGPNQDVMATFEIEGNPDDASLFGGKTIQIDKFAA